MDSEETPAAARLGEVRILSALSATELERLGARVRWRRVLADEAVVSHLADGGEVFFVLEGRFDVSMQSPIGRLVLIRQLTAGSHFGEIAALTGAPRSVSVIAQSDGLVAECSREAFLEAIQTSPGFGAAIATELARNVVRLTDKVFELSALEVRFRIYAELIRLAQNGVKVSEGVLIDPAPTHPALAAAVGAQREAVSRELRVLAEDGIVKRKKRALLILDLERLRTLLLTRGGLTATQIVNWQD